MKKTLIFAGAMIILTACSSHRLTEEDRFTKAVAKDIPLQMTGLRAIGSHTFTFENADYSTPPDYEIGSNGSLIGGKTSLWEAPKMIDNGEIWRNLYINKHQKRLICVDRIKKDNGKMLGLIYVMQAESKKWPQKGTYHWDVTNIHNMQSAAYMLEDFMRKSIKVIKTGILPDIEENKKYNSFISKADSCYVQHNYPEAERYFTYAFGIKNCVRGYHLYNAACAASLAGHTDAAFWFLNQRMEIEPKWYSEKIINDNDLQALHQDSRWQALMERMQARWNQLEANYDIPLRRQLQDIAKSDQDIRQKWMISSEQNPQNKKETDSLLSMMANIDSINQQRICHILDTRGFVGKEIVGDACETFWLVIQHSSVNIQRKYLPIFKKAAKHGDLKYSHVAMMEDRICMFEGRPQKYGSQLEKGKDGKWHLYRLENPAKVDEWRKAMGMPPLEEYLQMKHAER